MSSISVQHSPDAMGGKPYASKIPVWVWLAYTGLAAGLYFFDLGILSIGLIIYLAIRVMSSMLYGYYASNYKDYAAEYPDLFRDINDILGMKKNGEVQGFNMDPNGENKEQIEREKQLLYELQRKNNYEITRKERWQLAILSERYSATVEPLRLFLIYKADYPTDLDADYLIGKVLLDKNNKSGLTFLKRAFRKFNLILPICEVLIEYYFRIDNEEKLNYWTNQKNTFSSVATEAQLERVSLMPRDELIEASLSEKWMENIAEQLAMVKEVKAAWICEKIVKHYPEYPVYVLVVKRKYFFVDEQKMLSTLNTELDLPDTTLVISQSGRNRRNARRVKKTGVRILG